MKRAFITFEGTDGTGKTTQMALLAQSLRQQGYEVVTTREPGGTPLAERVRQLVLDASLPLTSKTESLLFMAARSEHVDQVIRPALQAGKIVLCDRFCDSTFVYQGLTQGLKVGDLAPLRQLNSMATDGLEPDLTLVLEGDPGVLLQRRQERGVKDRFENKGLDFQRQLRAGFLALQAAEPERLKIVNALQSVEQVAVEIAEIVGQYLRE